MTTIIKSMENKKEMEPHDPPSPETKWKAVKTEMEQLSPDIKDEIKRVALMSEESLIKNGIYPNRLHNDFENMIMIGFSIAMRHYNKLNY